MCPYLTVTGVALTAVPKLEYDKQLIASKYSQKHICVGLMYGQQTMGFEFLTSLTLLKNNWIDFEGLADLGCIINKSSLGLVFHAFPNK